MANLNEMTISEFTGVFNYLLDNNKELYEKGQTPIAIGLEGEAGIGKTAVVEEVAGKRGMTFCKLNLAVKETAVIFAALLQHGILFLFRNLIYLTVIKVDKLLLAVLEHHIADYRIYKYPRTGNYN